jgi:hypothetical protein
MEHHFEIAVHAPDFPYTPSRRPGLPQAATNSCIEKSAAAAPAAGLQRKLSIRLKPPSGPAAIGIAPFFVIDQECAISIWQIYVWSLSQ